MHNARFKSNSRNTAAAHMVPMPLQGIRRRPQQLPVLLFFVLLLASLCNLTDVCATRAAPVYLTPRSSAHMPPSEVLTHVTFASCNRQHEDQSFWLHTVAPVIAQERQHKKRSLPRKSGAAPAHTDLLLWLGNAVYADVDEAGVAKRTPKSIEGIAEEYRTLTDNPYYRQFIEEHVTSKGGRVMGIWDDRDLGLRFADANYPNAEAVRRLYLTELWKGYPLAVKDAAGDGAHGALYAFTTIPAPDDTPLAAHFVNSVCILTLDVRTQRSDLPNLADALLKTMAEDGLKLYGRRSRGYAEKLQEARATRAQVMEADVLGPAQWAWLEHLLSVYLASRVQSPGDAQGRAHCAVTLIASPWQILLNDNKPFEGWDLYPGSRSRLLALLQKYEVERFVFLSGHAEMGELGVVRRAKKKDVTLDGPTATIVNAFPVKPLTKAAATLVPHLPSYLVELTTGGVTHTVQEAPVAGWFAGWFLASRVLEDRKENGFVKRYIFLTRTTTSKRNFGTLQVIGDAATAAPHAAEGETEAHTPPMTRAEVLARTRVVLTLHAVQDGADTAPLVTFARLLDALPTYATDRVIDQDEEDEYRAEPEEQTWNLTDVDPREVTKLPYFTTFNIPGEIPWLKRRMAERQCAEVPCANGQHYMLLKIAGTLSLAFVAVVCFILLFYYIQVRHPELFGEEMTKMKRE